MVIQNNGNGGLLIDQYTSDFFSNQFDDLISIQLADDVWRSKIPFVEIPMEKPQILDSIYHQASTESFAASLPIADINWWTQPSYQGWNDLAIACNEKIGIGDYLNTDLRSKKYASWATKDLRDLVDTMLHNEGLSLLTCCIKKLDAGGWLNPHKDAHKLDCSFAYIWMPLHQFSPGMKIWPWGMLDHRYTHYYLLNNAEYVHAVWNRSDTARLVLVGFIDIENCKPEWKKRVEQAIDQQWNKHAS